MDTDAFSEELFPVAVDVAPEILGRVGSDAYANLFCEQSLLEEVRYPGESAAGPVRIHRVRKAGSAVHVIGPESTGLSWTDGNAGGGFKESARRAMAEAHVRTEWNRIVFSAIAGEDTGESPAETADALLKETVRTAVAAAHDLIPGAQGVSATVQIRTSRRLILDTTGFHGVKNHRLWNLRLESGMGDSAVYTIAGGTGSALGWESGFRVEELARKLGRRIRSNAEAVEGPTGDAPVVLAAGWGAVWLHEVIGHLLEEDNVILRKLAGLELGARVSGLPLTIADDPSLPGLRGSYAFDDEGSQGERTVLIKDGVLTGILSARSTGLSTGSSRNRPGTGNGRRQDFCHEPVPRMSNLVLEPGSAELEDLLKEAGNGLYATLIGNGKVNPEDGTYQLDVLDGFLIANGQLSQPIKPLVLRGQIENVVDIIRAVARDYRVDQGRGWCSKAHQVVPVSMGMPSILLDPVRVERR